MKYRFYSTIVTLAAIVILMFLLLDTAKMRSSQSDSSKDEIELNQSSKAEPFEKNLKWEK